MIDIATRWHQVSRCSHCAAYWAVAAALLVAPLGSPAQGGSGIKLNRPLAPGESISSSELTPDGRSLVYQVTATDAERTDTLVVPIGGGESTLLSGTLGQQYRSYGFMITPGSDRVLIWKAVYRDSNRQDLYTVPITGGEPIPLVERPKDAYLNIYSRTFNADGDRLVFWSDLTTWGIGELYTIPVAGGERRTIHGPLAANAYVSVDEGSQAVAPDRSRIAYSVVTPPDENGHGGGLQLFSAPTSGGASVALSDSLAGRIVGVHFTPDGSKVVYGTATGLYAADALLGTRVQLVGTANTYPEPVQFAPDGGTVVYSVSSNFKKDLFSVPVAGGDAVKLASNFHYVAGISPDSTRVVVKGDTLSSVPIHGGTPVVLSDRFVSAYSPIDAPSGVRVVYHEATAPYGLYSVKLDGTDRATLVESSASGFGLDNVTPDGRIGTFRSRNEERYILATGCFAVPIEGGTPVRITPRLPSETFVTYGVLTPDGSKLVYQTTKDFVRNNDGTISYHSGDLYAAGLPLAAVDAGDDVVGKVLGGVGFGGGLGYRFDHVGAGGLLTAEFFREPLADLAPELRDSINFSLPGETMHLWDVRFAGDFTGSALFTFTYDEALLRPGIDEANLAIYHRHAGGGWEPLSTLARDPAANTLTVRLDGFSQFSVGVVPEPSTLALFAIGAVGCWLARRSRRGC